MNLLNINFEVFKIFVYINRYKITYQNNYIILLNNNITPLEIALNNFYKFRKELKKPILETSKEALKNKLIKLSNNNNDTAIEIINQSMANGWQGIFELKNNQNGTNKDSNGKPISKYHN